MSIVIRRTSEGRPEATCSLSRGLALAGLDRGRRRSRPQQYRAAPKFEGKMIPEPPSQGQPWTAPATKLPKFLVTATDILFEQGVADPRGCEYRLVEIGNGSVVKVRGFVLPERADAPGRFVVCWDGLVYPALTVGDPVDLDSDIKDLAAEHEARARGREVESVRQGDLLGLSTGGSEFPSAPRASMTTRRSSSACCSGLVAPTWPRPSSPPGRPGRPSLGLAT